MGKDWKNKIISDAKAHGICGEYAELMSRAATKEDFLALYKRGIDWSLENNCPSVDYLRAEGQGFERLGLYIDHEFHGETLDDQQVYIFLNCKGKIRVGLNMKKRIIPMLYFSNGCEMEVASADRLAMQIRVPLYIYGENRISAEQSDDLICVTYKREVK